MKKRLLPVVLNAKGSPTGLLQLPYLSIVDLYMSYFPMLTCPSELKRRALLSGSKNGVSSSYSVFILFPRLTGLPHVPSAVFSDTHMSRLPSPPGLLLAR